MSERTPTLSRVLTTLPWLCAALWVGSMWGMGYLAVPSLFHSLSDNKMLAGMLAGKLFTIEAWAGITCATLILFSLSLSQGRQILRSAPALITLTMLALVLTGEFWLQPEMALLKTMALPGDVLNSPYADSFSVLHRIATTLFIAQSILGIPLLFKIKGS